MKLLAVCCLIPMVVAHTINGIESIKRQIVARDSMIDPIYENLPRQDIDFINYHLRQLTSFNGSDCDACKNKLVYGQKLALQQPEKQHLVSLLLYKYCVYLEDGKSTKCDNVDFFINTNSLNSNRPVNTSQGGYTSTTSVNFYDNDFLQMITHFNTSSDFDMESYCYYKADACDLPDLPDIDQYGFDSLWPEKKDQYNSEPDYSSSDRDLFNVLHLSDSHNQLRYQMASEANCSQGLCCLPETYNEDLPDLKNYNFTEAFYDLDAGKENQTLDLSFYPDAHYDGSEYVKGDYYDYPKYRGWDFASQPATTFGSYLCDPPEVLMNNSLVHVASTMSNLSFEYCIFTGDIVDHDEYHEDANTTKTAEARSYNIIKYFLKDLPFYPTLGNHDAFPYGQLASQDYSNHLDLNNSDYHWNEEFLAELWTSKGWIAKNQTQELKNHYAGFSVTTERGLKIISLNSNCYYQKNLWAYINLESNPDSFGQWEFLINELVESEAKGQRVWIMAHIPAGDGDALPLHSKIFSKIVERFSPYTIANIFYGHTHLDQFRTLYSDDQEPVNMAWISQAITPLGPSNPSYRYYQVEDESFNIINAYNYYTRLNDTFVNDGEEPEWSYEYNPRQLYDPSGTWPSNAPLNATFWDRYVVSNIKNQSDIDFNDLFTDVMHRFAPGVDSCQNGSVISDDCYNSNYCVVSSFTSEDYLNCLRDS